LHRDPGVAALLRIYPFNGNEPGDPVETVRLDDKVGHTLFRRIDDEIGKLAEPSVGTANRISEVEAHTLSLAVGSGSLAVGLAVSL
jgi:hypothetical protein